MKKFKKQIPLLLAGLISLLLVLSIMYLKDITPFGKKSFLTVDFLHQYAPMLKEMFNRLISGKSFVYSFNMGLGLPFYRNFFNYLSSPFNIIMFFFNEKTIITSYSFIIAIKVAASSMAMMALLNKKFNSNYLMIALSILYSFSAYFMAYYWNIMWLDGIIFLPLIILGVEKLVDDNKILLYISTMSLMMYANYFIGYMIAIFVVFYFISYILISKKDNKKIIIRNFILSSLLSVCTCALVIFPMFTSLNSISATSDAWPTSQYYSFTLKEFIFNHLSGVGTTVFSSGETNAPNISLSILFIMLIIPFFLNKKIELKTKLTCLIPLLFLILCFIVPQLDFIMHGLHVPNDLPYRYSFLYVFMSTIICAYSLDKIKSINTIGLIISYLISIAFIVLSKVLNFNNLSENMFILNLVIITCYFTFVLTFKYFKKMSFIAVTLFIVSACIECIIKYQENWNISYNTKSIYVDYSNIQNSLEFIRDNDSDIYRVDRPYITTFNDPDWFDYYGLTTFSSMSYENEAILMHALGSPGNEINSHYYKPNTPIFSMMFNLKYIFSRYPIKYYQKYESADNYDTYRSEYPTSLIFKSNPDLIDWSTEYVNPFEIQNDFIEKSTGTKDVLKNVNFEIDYTEYYEGDKTVIHYVTNDFIDNYYTYIVKGGIDFVIIDGTLYYMSDDYYYGYDIGVDVIDSADYNENYTIYVENARDIYIGYSDYIDDAFYAYYVDEDALNESYNTIKDNLIKIDEFSEHYISANVDGDKDSLVYTSIPYDSGWNVYIDGEKVEKKAIGNTLLAFDIEKGKHVIELKYTIPHIYMSLCITILSLPTIYLFNKKIKKRN